MVVAVYKMDLYLQELEYVIAKGSTIDAKLGWQRLLVQSAVVLCWSVIAVAVAALVRNLPVTIGLLLAFYFFIEAYLVEIPGLAYVLPFASGKAIIPEIGQVTLDNMAFAAGGYLSWFVEFLHDKGLPVPSWLDRAPSSIPGVFED